MTEFKAYCISNSDKTKSDEWQLSASVFFFLYFIAHIH